MDGKKSKMAGIGEFHMKKKKIVLWGTGRFAKEILSNSCFFENEIQICCIVDNDFSKWGTIFYEKEVMQPSYLKDIQFDKIVIASEIFFDEIQNTIIEKLHIEKSKIENRFYFAKIKLVERYRAVQNEEIKDIIHYLGNHSLEIFNYEFAEKYSDMAVNIFYDDNVKMYYVMHCGKRMYMSPQMNTKEEVLKYYCGICMEQDRQSPHVYMDEQFGVEEGDVVVDVGVAEGNFSLQVIDKVSKIYMIESDKDWIKALECTFGEYKDKVVMINKFVSDYTFGSIDSLDNMINEKVNFIKMDIEGCECEALLGARQLIKKSDKLRCAICVYHRDNDEMYINEIARMLEMKGSLVKGYMWYPVGQKQKYISPILRRGVIRYEKRS